MRLSGETKAGKFENIALFHAESPGSVHIRHRSVGCALDHHGHSRYGAPIPVNDLSLHR